MNPQLATIVHGRKFLWDGRAYPSRDDAARAATAYERDGFEVSLTDDGGVFLIYTRRLVKEEAVAL